MVAAVCAARAKACGSGLCNAVGGGAGGAGIGRLVPLRLVAANEVMLYPIEEEVLKRDSWIWVVSFGFVDFYNPAVGVV